MGTVSGKRGVKQIVYDLEKHWLFWKDTGGAVTLEELERQALYEPNIRGQAIFGDPLRTKPVRVLVNISAEGLIAVGNRQAAFRIAGPTGRRRTSAGRRVAQGHPP